MHQRSIPVVRTRARGSRSAITSPGRLMHIYATSTCAGSVGILREPHAQVWTNEAETGALSDELVAREQVAPAYDML